MTSQKLQPDSVVTPANAPQTLLESWQKGKVRPTLAFVDFVEAVVSLELEKKQRSPVDAIERVLWDAARFDNFGRHRDAANLLGGSGQPLDRANEYRRLIEIAIEPLQVKATE